MNSEHTDRWTGVVRAWARDALALVFPPQCAWCESNELPVEGPALCSTCVGELRESKSACARCGRFIGADRCPYCQNQPQAYESVTALGPYEGRLREVVLRLKRPRQEALVAALADLLMGEHGDRIRALSPDFVAPIPMHWRRRLARGANSAELLARHLARRGGWPVIPKALVRRRATRPQAALPPRQRLRNVQGAFALRSGLTLNRARVLVVDDILTTGATANEAARVLLRHGASSVGVAVLARA